MIMNGFYLYILRCNDKSYYIGHTDDLQKRFAEHQSGAFENYTSTWRPVKLVYSELFQTRDEAWLAKPKIKG